MNVLVEGGGKGWGMASQNPSLCFLGFRSHSGPCRELSCFGWRVGPLGLLPLFGAWDS